VAIEEGHLGLELCVLKHKGLILRRGRADFLLFRGQCQLILQGGHLGNKGSSLFLQGLDGSLLLSGLLRSDPFELLALQDSLGGGFCELVEDLGLFCQLIVPLSMVPTKI